MFAEKLAHENVVVPVSVNSDANDLANVLIRKHNRCPKPKPQAFIIQLARSSLMSPKFNPTEFAILLERLTDGTLETTKYQGASLTIPRPWVFVFANDRLPAKWKTDRLLTDDRWKEMVLQPLSAADIQKVTDFEQKLEDLETRPAATLVGFN